MLSIQELRRPDEGEEHDVELLALERVHRADMKPLSVNEFSEFPLDRLDLSAIEGDHTIREFILVFAIRLRFHPLQESVRDDFGLGATDEAPTAAGRISPACRNVDP